MSALTAERDWLHANANDPNRTSRERAIWAHLAMKLDARLQALGDFTSQYPYPSPHGHHLDHLETP